MAERKKRSVTRTVKVAPKRVVRGASAKGKKAKRAMTMPGFSLPKGLVRMFLGLVIVAGVGGTAYFGYAALNLAAQRPIKSIAIEGEFNFVTRDEISALIDPLIIDGFLKLPLMTVKQQLEQHPWISLVNVSRRWPDTLLISFTEQQAIARWGEIGFLNQYGDVIKVEQTPYLASLPWIEGDEEQAKLLMQQYQQFAQLLRPHGLKIAAFHADEVSDMTVSLNNGLVLNLGKDQVMEKFQRFLLVLQRALKGRLQQVASVDLRYGNGLAVQWREKESNVDATNAVAGRGF